MSSPITPCEKNLELEKLIHEFAEVLKHEAHKLGNHGLSERDFYQGGLFRGAIERVRGQQAATMKYKRTFVATVLDYMKMKGAIADWKSAGEANRHDYQVHLPNGRTAIIELKGCLDGNNTNIFDRPANANEFIVWSLCQNEGADPRLNAWSGIHTRLSAEIIDRAQVVDGLVIWDVLCGTVARPCPKLKGAKPLEFGSYKLPPPCIYLFPSTVPSVRNNPAPEPQSIGDVGFLKALFDVFGGKKTGLTSVHLEIKHKGLETVRRTRLVRGGVEIAASNDTPLQRS